MSVIRCSTELVSAGSLWTKSSHSTTDGPECVEVHRSPATIRVRDSTDPHGPQLAFDPTAWTAFLAFVTVGVADAP